MRRCFAWLCVLIAGVGVTGSAEGAEVTLTASHESHVEFIVQFGAPTWETVTVDGTEWRVASLPDTHAPAWGQPHTAIYTAMIGIPPDADVVAVEAEPIGTTVSTGAPLAPVPTPVLDAEVPGRVGGVVWTPGWDDAATELVPARWAEHQHTTWVRSRRVAVVHVYPIRTVPGSERVSAAEAVRVRVRFGSRSPERVAREGKVAPTRFERDPAAAALDARLVNGPASRAWLRSEAPRGLRRGVGEYFSSSSDWVRIRTDDEGIVRVTGADLEAVGATLAAIDPATIRMFAGSPFVLSETPPPFSDTPPWMRELAILVADGGDGAFSAGDRVEFFATEIDGFADQIDAAGDSAHVNHLYVGERAYWLTWGGAFGGAPQRMSVVDATPTGGASTTITQVRERVHLEENSHYSAFQKSTSSSARWEQWWWNSGYRQTDGGARGIVAQFPGHVVSTPSTLVVRFWGVTSVRHLMDMTVNTIPLPRQNWFGSGEPLDATFEFDAANDPFLDGRNTFTFRLDPSDDVRTRDEVLLAYIELDHERALTWPGTPFAFESTGIDETVVYSLSGLPASGIEVYEITDPAAPVRLASGPIVSGTLDVERTEIAAERRRYLVADATQRVTPVSVERDVAPARGYLREFDQPVDYVVIYADEFAGPANALVELRSRITPGVPDPSVLAVRVSDVFDEFSWGIEDVTAIRNFLKWAYEHYRDPADPTTPRLTFATLIGDADFDHRDFETAANEDLIPAWSGRFDNNLRSLGWNPTWPEDAYLGLFEGPTEYGVDVHVGRLPAKTIAEATAMVGKTIDHHDAAARDDWQRRVILVADDLCQGTDWDGGFYRDWTHTRQAEALVDVLPLDTTPVRVYLVDYPDPVNGVRCIGGDKPSARDALIDAINDGAWLVDYVGHGGETVMADERVLVSADVPQMTNAGRYHYFVTASCTVGKFDDEGEGLAETVLKQEGGGSVNSYSAAAVAFSGSNAALNLSLLDNMVRGDVAHPDSLRAFGAGASLSLLDVPQLNTRKYNVLGDPANTMARPPFDVDLSIRAADGSALGDTLWRAERVNVTGRIVDPTTRATLDADGRVSLRVIDSEEFRERQPTDDWNPKNYFLPGAPMFRGDLDVTDGEFDVSFVVPSGLRRGTRGAARLRAYFSGEGGVGSSIAGDAIGSLDSLVVPDAIRPEFALDDSVGPEISLTWDAPVAAIPAGSNLSVRLNDEEGIYITQLLDSRAAVLTFEDESGFVQAVIDLAPAIEFEDGPTSVELTVPIPPALLANRPYMARVRASDNLGNRSAVVESIYLVATGGLGVQRVFAYPNPATSGTGIFVDASREFDVDLRFYTVSGRLIRSIEHRLAPGEGRTRPLEWDLRDEDGDRVANGSYHYVLRLDPTDGGAAEERRGWVAVLR